MMRPDAGCSEQKYKGVRKRKWGKWVSEVRLPNSRDRIWLGSYDSPEKAARAFDAATVCLRGRKARLNFPNNPPDIPALSRPMTHPQIQAAAVRHAHSAPAVEHSSAATAATTAAVDNSSAAADSPSLSTSEASEEAAVTMAAASMADWSCLDLMTDPFMDDFYYDFMAPATGMAGAADGAAADDGGNGFGATSSLWNF